MVKSSQFRLRALQVKSCYRKITSCLAAGMVVALLLGACGEDTTAPAPAPRGSVQVEPPTATPPFPARQPTSTPVPPLEPTRATFNTVAPPPLFPTSTLPPAPRPGDFTATAGVPSLNLTPLAYPTGQLAYVQAGNLWVIDDTGGNRRQLTSAADIAGDALMEWNATREKVVYISRAGELWLVDLQGKRTLVFSPGQSARAPSRTGLPPLPTPPVTVPPRPAQTGLRLNNLRWSPDGRYLGFNYYAGESGPLASGEVWIADLLTDKVSLTRAGEGLGITWSPDSKSLAFAGRGEVRQGANRPPTAIPNLTPPGTSLLPPGPPLASTPGVQAPLPAGTSLLPPTRPRSEDQAVSLEQSTVSPTPFVIRPGQPGSTPPGTGGVNQLPSPTAPPTPTLNLVTLPSPTPTPTYPPVYLGSYVANRLITYNLSTRRTFTVSESDRLPDAFLDNNNLLRSYVPAPFQAVWWSPDGRYLAFADRLSVVGVVAAAGGTPVIWTGEPQNFAVYELEWLPRSDGAFFRNGNPYQPELSRLNLVTFNNLTGSAPGASGDVTNRGLIKLDVLPASRPACPELSPGGNFFSYYDGAVLVILRTNGAAYVSYPDTGCPGWSPFGRAFASIRQSSDGAIVLNTLDQPQGRVLQSTRAVERVFWLRSDPSFLGGQPPAPTPRP